MGEDLVAAREAVTAAVLKRDPASLFEALTRFDNERQAVCVASEAVARANKATREWWAAPDRKEVPA